MDELASCSESTNLQEEGEMPGTKANIDNISVDVLSQILAYVLADKQNIDALTTEAMPYAAFVCKKWLQICFDIALRRHVGTIEQGELKQVRWVVKSVLVWRWYQYAKELRGMSRSYKDEVQQRLRLAYANTHVHDNDDETQKSRIGVSALSKWCTKTYFN